VRPRQKLAEVIAATQSVRGFVPIHIILRIAAFGIGDGDLWFSSLVRSKRWLASVHWCSRRTMARPISVRQNPHEGKQALTSDREARTARIARGAPD
jgi:hypothetical protein